eukprot:8526576-Pyramimonas_sp.AAC.1
MHVCAGDACSWSRIRSARFKLAFSDWCLPYSWGRAMRSRVAAAALQSRVGAPRDGAVPPTGETVDAGRSFR